MGLSQKIKTARKEAGLKQTEASKRMGVTKQQWHQWEDGVYVPSYKSIEGIARALGISVAALVSVGE